MAPPWRSPVGEHPLVGRAAAVPRPARIAAGSHLRLVRSSVALLRTQRAAASQQGDTAPTGSQQCHPAANPAPRPSRMITAGRLRA